MIELSKNEEQELPEIIQKIRLFYAEEIIKN
jgi:hypothetical protein